MYLVTGSAGFIGFHTCLRLLQNNFNVLGIDNLNNYYDVKLKKKRNEVLSKYKNFSFIKADILDKNGFFICNHHFCIEEQLLKLHSVLLPANLKVIK